MSLIIPMRHFKVKLFDLYTLLSGCSDLSVDAEVFEYKQGQKYIEDIKISSRNEMLLEISCDDEGFFSSGTLKEKHRAEICNLLDNKSAKEIYEYLQEKI